MVPNIAKYHYVKICFVSPIPCFLGGVFYWGDGIHQHKFLGLCIGDFPPKDCHFSFVAKWSSNIWIVFTTTGWIRPINIRLIQPTKKHRFHQQKTAILPTSMGGFNKQIWGYTEMYIYIYMILWDFLWLADLGFHASSSLWKHGAKWLRRELISSPAWILLIGWFYSKLGPLTPAVKEHVLDVVPFFIFRDRF